MALIDRRHISRRLVNGVQMKLMLVSGSQSSANTLKPLLCITIFDNDFGLVAAKMMRIIG